MGLVPYFMWNVTDNMYSNVFYGANFVDYVGYVENKLTMVRPVNGVGYDSFICQQYFDLTIDGPAAPDATTVDAILAIRAIPDRVAYVASKGGQLGLMRALALDLGKYNIRVNAVLPGMIKTDRWEKNPEFYRTVPSRFTPIGEVAVGADIADAAYYFAAHAKNTTGAELVVDGGNTIQLYPIIPKD